MTTSARSSAKNKITIAEWLIDSMVTLQKAGIAERGRTDCIVLLCDALGKDKSWVHTHPEYVLENSVLQILNQKLQLRAERQPLAYIRDFKEFYGRNFVVDKRVLIPRPESESFIELLRKLTCPNRIADIGTGSGCLGITAALELPSSHVDLIDNDLSALEVAQANQTALHATNTTILTSDLLNNLPTTAYDVLLANLPYVPDDMVTSPEITREPAQALFAGDDGLDDYRIFWTQVDSLKQKPRFILTESLEDQHDDMKALATQAGYSHKDTDLLVQCFLLNY